MSETTNNGKPKVAFFDFACCEGCQLTVVDSLQTHLDLLDAVEIVQFREAMTEKGEDYQIAFIEGSCTRQSDEARLKKIRAQADLVVALGACAHLGGVNALKNLHPLEDVRQWVYGDKADWYETYEARPIDAVIKVDAVIPGCPIDREEFVRVVKAVLLGKKPPVPDYPVCVECKKAGNVCVFEEGGTCLGPVTRAGCNAICITTGRHCWGCRGLVNDPNIDSEKEILQKYGLTVQDILGQYRLFNGHYPEVSK